MTIEHIPLKNPAPDSAEFIDIMLGKKRAKRIPLVEYIIDDAIRKPIIKDILGKEWTDYGDDRASQTAYLDNYIEVWYRMGHDFVRYEDNMGFTFDTLDAEDCGASEKDRSWANEGEGVIKNWGDFERYPWPEVDKYDFFAYEYLSKNLPEGMGLITSHGAGIFEHLSWILSLTGLSLLLYDDPALVKAVADKVGGLIIEFYQHLLSLDNMIAVFQGDDMGFKSGTLISPADLRKYVLPWQKKFSETAHEAGRPFFLHSCGNLKEITEDIIEDIKVDAKHSYEDIIIPADEFYTKYGSRMGVLGGVDLNILSGKSPEEVRAKTRSLMEKCNGGRYAIGSGNSVPSYVPVQNYLAMIDEAALVNREMQ